MVMWQHNVWCVCVAFCVEKYVGIPSYIPAYRDALLIGRSRDRSPVVSLEIFSVVPFDKTMCPEVDSASENEYQEFILG